MSRPALPPASAWEPLLELALAEDLGRAGDVTSEAVVELHARATARLVARRAGTIAGLPLVGIVLRRLDRTVEFRPKLEDGDRVEAGALLAEVAGPARALLAGERTALNLLGHLSGIATATRAQVESVAGTRAGVVDTRKTTPGLRALEKYAVRCGGGRNHRFGLDDAVLIKDNHVAVAGGVREAVSRARARAGHLVKVEVEITRIEQLEEAIEAGADVVMLDNFPIGELYRAVEQGRGRVLLEASGGITPRSLRAVAESGVDLVSLGWITHSAPALDVALEFD
ncbi:MAG: carboxylating nicotinate-nucleotide diphosphorylase [Thermoanaerobaculia bacterium]|nr:MAG: carboxylating nicotinate-nucleotide diphosphorylase [Thermoanaerobaculia bacterium]